MKSKLSAFILSSHAVSIKSEPPTEITVTETVMQPVKIIIV